MKTAILFGVLGLGSLVFLLALMGVFDYFINPAPPVKDEGPTDKATTGRIDYLIYDEKVENKVIFDAQVSGVADIERTSDEPPSEIDAVAKHRLFDLVLTPGTLSPSDTAVTIKAGLADLYQHARGKEENAKSFFHIYLSKDVTLEARQSTSLMISTDAMEYWWEQRRIRSNGVVHIHDIDNTIFHLAGTGMEGMLDFRSITVRDNPVTYMVSSAFEERQNPDVNAPQNITRITCAGPVRMRRFERPEDIGAFLAEFEKFKALGLTEQVAVDFLTELQKRMREEGVSPDDRDRMLDFARTIAEMQGLPNATGFFSGDAVVELQRTLISLRQVSPLLTEDDLAMLRDISAKITNKDLDLSGEKGLVSLTVVIFEKNVRAAARPASESLETLVHGDEKENEASFAFPCIDSSQECDRMIIYCREEPSRRKTGGTGIEPVKIEMRRGADSPVIIKSFGPRGAERKDLDTFQSADRADVYTARRIYQSPSGEQQTRFVQTRMVLDGAVKVQKFERQQKQSPDITSAAVYDANGERLVWDRDLGSGRLVGTEKSRPTLTYSSAPSMAPASAAADSKNVSTSVEASAADSIEFFRKTGESMTRVRLNRDVAVDRSEVSPAGKRHDSLKASAWVEVVFRQDAMQRKEPDRNLFSNIESMRALGKVDLVSDKGEAWGDYLTHEKGAFADRAAAITTIYRITEANRKDLIGEEEFTGGDWPLRAVMTGAGKSSFLTTTGEEEGAADRLETYTSVCEERIQYIDFVETTPLAGKTIFTRNVRITKTTAGAAGQTTLDASEKVELDFVKAANADAQAGKKSFDPARLYAEGQVHMTEPGNKQGVSQLQEAKCDRLTWTRLSAEEAGGKATDRALLEGGNGVAPEIRYSTVQKVDVKKENGSVETETDEEQTIMTCSAAGGRITTNTLRDPKQREKLEDNYILAEGDAYVHRTDAQTDAAGKRTEDPPMDLHARKLTTYYIPATEKGTATRMKKIIADDNVVATSDQATATGAHGEWERFYQADIVERTILTAAPGGAATVRIIGKDKRDRPTDTTITCADKVVFTRTLYDEAVNPKVSAKTDAVFTNTVSVTHLGFADQDKKLNEDTYLTCDQLNVKFADTMRVKTDKSATHLDIAQMIATGKAAYEVFELLREEHKYPDERVLFSDGKADYIEYNKESAALTMRMKGKRNESGRLVEPAFRRIYEYDSKTRERLRTDTETETEQGELPPLPMTGKGFGP